MIEIPKDEQVLFPANQDISIVVSVKWTSFKFKNILEKSNLVF